MTPTSFEFTVTIPGDARLVDAMTRLAAHAAGYAQLPAGAGERLSHHVARATETAIAATHGRDALIELRFSGDERALEVVISCDAPLGAGLPQSSFSDGLTAHWSANGTRQTCRIRQPIPA